MPLNSADPGAMDTAVRRPLEVGQPDEHRGLDIHRTDGRISHVEGNGARRHGKEGMTALATVHYDCIPTALTQRPQWVCWRYDDRGDQRTKVPVDPHTGQLASVREPATWSSFQEAITKLERDGSLAGVGFVFTADDPFCGIDLDDCVGVDGTVTDEAQAIIASLDSYTEISPSGTGLKVFIEGRKPPGARARSKAVEGCREIEIYDQGRFFCVTGRRYDVVSANVAKRESQLADLCERLWPPQRTTSVTSTPAVTTDGAFEGDDDRLIEVASQAANGDAFRNLFDGDTSLHGGDDSAADLALCNHLAFWCGRDKARMDRLFRRSGLYRSKWEREDYRDWTLDKAIADCRETYRPGGGPASSSSGGVPIIHLDVDEHRVVEETIALLAADATLYQRGSTLVRILRRRDGADGVVRPDGAATITPVPTANLRERMTRHARFTRCNHKGEVVAAHPASWLVAAVEARGEWPGIPQLMGVADAPILRADGSLHQSPGYDPQTGVLFEPAPGMHFPHIREDVGEDDASAALDELLEVVCDFRFEAEEHKSAWLAGLLTPLARFAFTGPSPLFLIDANVRGAGKGLLAQTIGQVALGREMPVSSYAHDAEEMRKKITALAIAGDRMILLDNLEGSFGNDALDRALTSTRWKDRVLGKSEQVDLPLLPVWYGTGNNVHIAADTTRRIIHVRLDVLEEQPENRTGFRHPDLIGWVQQHRGRLLAAALTILTAYCRAGRPEQALSPFGSFEGWSHLVRAAVVWVGMPDPCLTRMRLAEAADTTVDTLRQLMEAWREVDTNNNGLVVAELLNRLYPRDTAYQPRDEAAVHMRAALESLVGCPPGKAPTNRQVGNKLKHYRRRVVDGVYLDIDPDAGRMKGSVWKLMQSDGCASDVGP